MSSREYLEWVAYSRMEPIAGDRSDLHAGIIASVLANLNRDVKTKSTPYKVGDFIPDFWPTEQEEALKQSWEAQLAMVEMLNVAFGGVDKRN